MNRYGAMARDHWRRQLPDAYALLQDPDKYFLDLGDDALRRIEDLEEALRGSDPPDKPFADRMNRFARARQTAEEIVIHEDLLTTPETVTSEEPTADEDDYVQAVSEFYRARDELLNGEST